MASPVDVHEVFARHFRGIEALAYAVSARLEQGSICLDIKRYLEEDDPGGSNPYFTDRESFAVQTEEGTYVTREEGVLKPFVTRHGRTYLHRYYQYETQIIRNIERMGDHFRIVTGGPGTGKTYGVAMELAERFREDPGLKVALAAPTGKAAARMNEAIRIFAADSGNDVPAEVREKLTALSAVTIHRLLGYRRDSVFFRYDETRKLPFDMIIVDECSMIDGALMAKLLNAVDDGARLYLVGDKDQLASVEAGSVFGDMCRLEGSGLLQGKIRTKTESRRFSKEKGIGRFSAEVIRGTFPDLSSYRSDDQITIDTDYSEELFREVAVMYMESLLEPDPAKALRALNKVRFLCVTREHDRSVAETNRKIEGILQRQAGDPTLFRPRGGMYHNQPVIVTRNDYNLKLNNGDVGLIREKDGVLVAFFETSEGGIREIQAGYLNHFETVFAMTIHKSQGSEFDHVALLLPEKQGERLLTRELLYTGVTRARKSVLLQATSEVLRKCVEREVSRVSGLQQRLNHT